MTYVNHRDTESTENAQSLFGESKIFVWPQCSLCLCG